nr:hypothetical protein [uncultured Allomuricauda sp.]
MKNEFVNVKNLLWFCIIMLFYVNAQGQVGIGTVVPDESAQLDVVSEDKGVLIPRIALTGINDAVSITNGNVESLLVFNTATTDSLFPGFYYWDGLKWQRLINPDDVTDFIANGLDSDPTNEIQDLEQVLTEGNDAGGNVISNLGVPTLDNDAVTKAYVDAISINGAVDASATEKGIVQLTGDLAGTATNPEVANNAIDSGNIINGAITNDDLNKTNIPLSGFGDPEADINMNNKKITGVLDPDDPQDAATKAYVDANAGGTVVDASATDKGVVQLTGELTGSATSPEIADGVIDTGNIQDGTISEDDLDKGNIALSGFGLPTADINMNNKKITGVLDPDDPQDAATKLYVDDGLADTEKTANKNEANGYAGLDASAKVPVGLLPGITLNSVDVVASQSDQLALTGVSVGAVVVRTDQNKTYINRTGDNDDMNDWELLLTGTGNVSTVNTESGTVLLDLNDILSIGADAGNKTITSLGTPVNPTDAATKAYVDTNAGSTVVDASATEKGIVQLTGELTGSATSPEIADGVIDTGNIQDGTILEEDLDKANIPLSGFGDPEADINMNNKKITGVLDPDDPQDAATKAYVDANAGGTVVDASATDKGVVQLTGELTGSATSPEIADGVIDTGNIQDGTISEDDLDKGNIALSGFGLPTADINMNNKKITGVLDPDDPQDAATKLYVDDGLADTEKTANKNEANGYAGLDASAKVPVGLLPGITLNSVDVVASQSDQLALTGVSVGAVVVRTDQNKTYINRTGDNDDMNDWELLLTGTGNVSTVNTESGTVLLDLNDILSIGADADNKTITSLGTPVNPTDAATKGYVDGKVAVNATAAAPGIVQLAGELTGSATSPEIADGVIDTGNIQDGTILEEDLDKTNIPLSGFGDPLADINMNNKKITGVLDPDDPQDAATKAYVDANAGGTVVDASATDKGVVQLTGELTGSATSPEIADGVIDTGNIQDGTISEDDLDKANIPLSGFGDPLADINMNNKKITGVLDPDDPQDAATKLYVDDGLADTEKTANKNEANGYAGLDASAKVPIEYLPGITINSVDVVTSQAAQLSLIGVSEGAVVVRTDESKTYINKTGNNGSMGDWELLLTGTGDVSTVNGENGTVVLELNDILSIGTDAGSKTITNLGTPMNPTDAATKDYVDGKVAVNATAAAPGIVQLTGDLAGTATNPEVANNAIDSGNIINGAITNDDLNKTNIPLSGFGLPMADISMAGQRFTNLAEPASNQDAATKNYVDEALTDGVVDASLSVKGIVKLSGDLTGTADAPQIASAAVTTAKLNDDAVTTDKIKDGTITEDDLKKEYIRLSGFGEAGADVGMGGFRLKRLADPEDPQDAATRSYVDDKFSAGVIDASASAKGVLKLSGDLAGTADSPEVSSSAISTSKLADGAVTTVKLATGAVDNTKLADNAVQTDNIVNNAVSPTKLQGITDNGTSGQLLSSNGNGNFSWASGLTDALTSGYLLVGNGSGKAGEVEISGDATIDNTGALTIANDAVTTDKIINDAVATAKIADGAVTEAKLAANAVTNDKLANDAVQMVNIADGTASGQVMKWDGSEWVLVDLGSVTVTENDGIIGNEVTQGTDGTLIRSGAGTTVSPYTLDVATGGITVNELADDAVTTDKIINAAVATAKIADGAVTATKLNGITTNGSSGQVLSSTGLGGLAWTDGLTDDLASANLLVGNVSNKAAAVTLSGDASIDNTGALTIANDAVTTDKLDANAVTTDKLDANAVTTDKIADGAVTATKLNGITTNGSSGQVLSSTGLGGLAWTDGLTDDLASANLLVGNVSNKAAAVTLSGDASIDNTGALTIANDAVTTDKLDANAVTTAKIADGAVTTDKLDANAVTTDKIANGAVTTDKLDANAVTTDKIANGAVTATKLQGITTDGDAGQVLSSTGLGGLAWTDGLTDDLASANLLVGNVSNKAAAVTLSGDASIDNTGALTIANDAVTTDKLDANAVTTDKLDANAVTTDKLDANAVTTDKLDANAVTTDKIANGAVTATKLQGITTDGDAGQVLSSTGLGGLAWTDGLTDDLASANLLVGNVSNKAAAVTLSGDASIDNTGALTIANDAVTTDKLDANAVTTDKLDANAVTTDKIADGAVTATKLNGITTNGSSGQVLSSTGLGGLAWTDGLTDDLASANLLVGNVSNKAAAVTLSGDATIDNTGALTIANDAVTTDKIINDAVATAKIANGAVTATKLQGITTDGDAGQVLSSTGLGGLAWTDGLTDDLASANLLVGNVSNKAAAVTLSGDASIDNTGALTIANDAVTTDKIINDAVATAKIANGAVTATKLQGITTDGDAGQVLSSTGLGGLAWTDGLTDDLASANLLVGNVSNKAAAVTLSGDASIDNTGALTIANDAVTTDKIINDAVATAKIANGAVTATKLQGITTDGDAGQVLSSTGLGGLAWTDGLTDDLASANLLVGNVSNKAAAVTLSGDASIDNTGALTIANDAVTTDKLDANAVTTDKIANGAVTTDKLDANAVTTDKLDANAVTTDKLDANAVTTDKIANGAVTATKLQGITTDGDAGQVLSSTGLGGLAWTDGLTDDLASANLLVGNVSNKAAAVTLSGDASIDNTGALTIANDAVTTDKLDANAVTTDKLDANAVTTDKIADGAVTATKLNGITTNGSSGQVLSSTGLGGLAWTDGLTDDLASANLLVGNVSNKAAAVTLSGDATIDNTGALTIANDAVTTDKIINDAVATAKIANGAVTATKLQGITTDGDAGQVLSSTGLGGLAWTDGLTDDLASANLLVGNVSNKAAAVTLSGDASIDNTGALTIANDAVTTDKLDANAVTTDKLDANAVTTDKIANGAVTATKLQGITTDGDAGQVLSSTGLGGLAWTDGLTDDLASANLLVGNVSNKAAAVTLSGDASIDNTGALTIANDAVTTDKLDANAVTTDKIADGAVTTDKLDANAVTTDKIANGAVTATKLQGITTDGDAGQVLSSTGLGGLAWTDGLTDDLASANLLVGNVSNKAAAVTLSGDASIDNTGALTIANDAVTTDKLDANAVTTAKIADGAVTTDKLDANAVTTDKIANGAVTTDKLDANAVTTDKIANGAVTATKLQGITTDGDAGQVLSSTGLGGLAWTDGLTDDLASANLLVGNVSNKAAAVTLSGDASIDNTGALTIANDAVTTDKLDANAVTTDKLDANAVTTDKIANGAVTATKLNGITTNGSSGQVLSSTGLGGLAWTDGLTDDLASANLLVGNVSNKAAAVTLSGDASIDNTGALTIANDAVTTDKIINDAVATAKIANGAVTATKLQGITTDGDAGQVLSSTGLGGLAWTDGLTDDLASANLLVGNVSNKAAAVTLSGDASIDNTGALTIANDAVTTDKLDANAVTTDKLDANAVTTDKIANGAVTATKLQGITTDGDAGQVLSSTGLGGLAWTDGLTDDLASANLLVGNVSNKAAAVTLSGDASIDNTGALTIANDAVTTDKLDANAVTANKIAGITDNTIEGKQLISDGTGGFRFAVTEEFYFFGVFGDSDTRTLQGQLDATPQYASIDGNSMSVEVRGGTGIPNGIYNVAFANQFPDTNLYVYTLRGEVIGDGDNILMTALFQESSQTRAEFKCVDVNYSGTYNNTGTLTGQYTKIAFVVSRYLRSSVNLQPASISSTN